MNIELYPGSYINHTREEDYIEIKGANDVSLRVYVLSDTIVRFRYATDVGFEDDFSYSIDQKHKFGNAAYEVVDDPGSIIIKTSMIYVVIAKSDLKKRIFNNDHIIVLEDEKGFHWEENHKEGGNIVQMSKVVNDGEHYYGLGDKPVHLNLRGKRFVNWGMDEYGFHKGTDPLYKSIPFYIGLHSDVAYGVFFDNTFKSYFDFASERRAVTSYWADGGEMNYYFIYGPAMIDVTRQYNLLTGRPELPPLWALGYHQCKWSYYPESKVREITSKMRSLRIPCDAFYLDIDYMDGFRCFTWDLEKFPHPKEMVSDLKSQGFKTIVIIDPGIKIDKDYDVFVEGLKEDVYCRRADGPYIKGKVWPGDCYFPDFTNPDVRKWWSYLFEHLISEVGVKGVWNDMNEPALFEIEGKTFPLDVRHDYDGHPCSHRKAHNVYGMQMARATYRGVRRYSKPDRPFVITRSVYSGGQRYSSAWTGDNIATWEHLWLANVQVQRMSISGFSFIGSDVGGFIEQPTPELYVRWVQLAAFHPFFRTHSSGDHGDQEPWSFGEAALNIVRKFIELRYKMLPYIYTTFYRYAKDGYPIVRPISMVDQLDKDTLYRADECMIGDDILICPILEANSKGRYTYLPKGDWYNYWTDEQYQGQEEHFISFDLETSPVFVRAGATIPNWPIMQYVGEKAIEEVTLHTYVNVGSYSSLMYEDAGDGYDYEKGVYNEKTFITNGTAESFELQQEVKGHFDTSYDTYRLIVHGLYKKPKSFLVNGIEDGNWQYDQQSKTMTASITKKFLSVIIQR